MTDIEPLVRALGRRRSRNAFICGRRSKRRFARSFVAGRRSGSLDKAEQDREIRHIQRQTATVVCITVRSEAFAAAAPHAR
jgi:hypothetical protein